MQIEVTINREIPGYKCACGEALFLYVKTYDKGKHYFVEIHCPICSTTQVPIMGGRVKQYDDIAQKERQLLNICLNKGVIKESEVQRG